MTGVCFVVICKRIVMENVLLEVVEYGQRQRHVRALQLQEVADLLRDVPTPRLRNQLRKIDEKTHSPGSTFRLLALPALRINYKANHTDSLFQAAICVRELAMKPRKHKKRRHHWKLQVKKFFNDKQTTRCHCSSTELTSRRKKFKFLCKPCQCTKKNERLVKFSLFALTKWLNSTKRQKIVTTHLTHKIWLNSQSTDILKNCTLTKHYVQPRNQFWPKLTPLFLFSHRQTYLKCSNISFQLSFSHYSLVSRANWRKESAKVRNSFCAWCELLCLFWHFVALSVRSLVQFFSRFSSAVSVADVLSSCL